VSVLAYLPPKFISIPELHYGEKTGSDLVKLAQMAGMDNPEN